MRALPDVNLLVALADMDHQHHSRAMAWVDGLGTDGWATCAITENGMVRIVSQSSYPHAVSPLTATRILEATCRGTDHEYWPCDVTIRDANVIDRERVLGPRQVTDVYLLALAVAHGGQLVTFDHGITLAAVPGATPEHLVVL